MRCWVSFLRIQNWVISQDRGRRAQQAQRRTEVWTQAACEQRERQRWVESYKGEVGVWR